MYILNVHCCLWTVETWIKLQIKTDFLCWWLVWNSRKSALCPFAVALNVQQVALNLSSSALTGLFLSVPVPLRQENSNINQNKSFYNEAWLKSYLDWAIDEIMYRKAGVGSSCTLLCSCKLSTKAFPLILQCRYHGDTRFLWIVKDND